MIFMHKVVSASAAVIIITISIFMFSEPCRAAGADNGDRSSRGLVLGYTVDLLPIVMTAASGRMGFSFQTWMGVEHVRLRLVGAQMRMPDALVENSAFEQYDLTVGAMIIDYVFRDDFSGWWIGSGFELWQNRLQHRKSGERIYWASQVFTVGGGYIWKIAGNVFVEPWAAAHMVMNNRTIHSGSDRYTPRRLSGEVSLKFGYFFTL